MNRRGLLGWIGGLGGVAGGVVGGKALMGKPEAAHAGGSATQASVAMSEHPHDQYGSMTDAPSALGPLALSSVHDPGPVVPLDSQPRKIEISVIERCIEVAQGISVDAWTYNGTVPGPTLRATEGQILHVTLLNETPHPHSLHFHGSHAVDQDGWQLVPPGSSRTYVIRAGPVGLHPYHCHTAPLANHFDRGMYGVMIVDPLQPRSAANEFVLSLCGWDVDRDGQNEIYAWNGVAGFYHRFPLKVPVGEQVRLYVSNLVEHDPIASFHLHAQTFDVIRSGTSLVPHDHTDVITLGQIDRAILEFRLPARGRYMFHPHQTRMTERGAMGWITAI